MKISVYLAAAPKAAKSTTDGKSHQVCFRIREGDADMRVRSGLLVNPSLWDSSIPGYRRTAKLPKEEIEAVNRQVCDVTRLIHDGYTPDRDASWLRSLVEKALNPNVDERDMKKEDYNSMIALFHRYFAGLHISKGRLGSIKTTASKLERYQAFRREIMGETSFTLDVHTITTAGIQEIWDYTMTEYRHYAEHP